jgi:hypothetical protein
VIRRLLVLLVSCVAPLCAQEGSLTLDVGGARVQQSTINSPREAPFLTVPAAIGSVRARVTDRWWLLGFDLSGTAADSVTAAQAIGLATIAPLPWTRTDIAYAMTSIGLGADGTSRTRSATLRQQLSWRNQLGVWVQGDRANSVRFTRRYDGDAIGATAWWRSGPMELWSGVQRVWTNDGALLAGGVSVLSGPTPPVRYTDAFGGIGARVGRVELSASARQRSGLPAARPGTDALRVAGDARAVVHLTPAFAVELSHAQQFADPLRGAPEARVTTLLLRLQRMSRRRAVTWTAVDGGAEVTIRVKGSDPAEITGSFANWEPRAMTREGGSYTLRLRLPSGTHRLAIRRAGGEWRAPEGLPRSTDEFGGESGLLVIP